MKHTRSSWNAGAPALRRAIPALVIATWACAPAQTTSPGQIKTEVSVQPIPRAQAKPLSADSLPGLSVLAGTQLSDGSGASRRIDSLDAIDQDIQGVLRGLASSYGLSLDIEPEVAGRVTTTLKNVTLREALASIVTPQGYTFEITDGVLRVGGARSQTRIFALDYVALNRIGSASTSVSRSFGGAISGGGGGGGSDQISSSTVADLWDEIRVALDALIFDAAVTGETVSSTAQTIATGNVQSQIGNNGLGAAGGSVSGRAYARATVGRRLLINPMAGTITVTAPPAKLEEVSAFIATFESSVQRQVLIEAKIVDVSLTRESAFGIDWNQVMNFKNLRLGLAQTIASSAPAGISLTLSGGGDQVIAVLRALQTQGTVNVMASPRVSALNNQPAIFRVTTEEVVFTATRQPILGPNGGTIGFNNTITPQQVSVGIVLHVIPQIGANNTITMSVRPHINSVLRVASYTSEDGNTSQVPVLEERETDTMVRTRAGETVVIGGLMQTRITNDVNGVPGLRNIPLLGKLFESRREVQTKSELVIFITATIVAGQPPVAQ